MQRTPTAIAAGVALLSVLGLEQRGPSLLTLPQRDRLRSLGSRPSAAVSVDGRFIAFGSFERLLPADTDSRSDIYLLDRLTGELTLESAPKGGAELATDCVQPRISGDGRFIVFETALPRPSGSRVGADVVLRDRVTGATRHVNLARGGGHSDGWSADVAIDATGSIVVFTSTATDLVDGEDANGPQADVYAFVAATGTIERISLDLRGTQPAFGFSVSPALSADGRHVAFTSTAPLDEGVPRPRGAPVNRGMPHVFIRDLRARTVKRIAPRGVEPNGPSMAATISGDGRFVAFVSQASNIVDGDRNKSADVFLYDATSDTIVLVSRGVGGRSANGVSGSPSISADGRLIAFHSDASDLVCAGRCAREPEDINLLPDVFVYDRVAGTITRASGGADAGWMEESAAPVLDGTGGVLAFASKHPTDAEDTGDDFDLFVRVSYPNR
jgi:Tol biopolymer transport system component